MSKISNLEDAIKLKKIKQKYINQKEKVELDILLLQRELEVIEQQLKECNISRWLEIQTFLLNDLLINADNIYMYYSIEARVPFLEHELIEFINSS